jgi:hypothetical protein
MLFYQLCYLFAPFGWREHEESVRLAMLEALAMVVFAIAFDG